MGHRLRPKALGKGEAHLFHLVVEPAMTTPAPNGAQHRAGTWGKVGIYKQLICHGAFKLSPLYVFLRLSSFYSQIPVNRAGWIGSAPHTHTHTQKKKTKKWRLGETGQQVKGPKTDEELGRDFPSGLDPMTLTLYKKALLLGGQGE